jgi:DNA primase
MPKRAQYADDESRLREALFQMHEIAAESFRANLQGPAGETARAYLAAPRPQAGDRSSNSDWATPSAPGARFCACSNSAISPPRRSSRRGLARRRGDGSLYDSFRGRLMFPIHNEMGKVIAFGGRGLADDDGPKYLNSPDTPIYTKRVRWSSICTVPRRRSARRTARFWWKATWT